jgi:hypothetical protein
VGGLSGGAPIAPVTQAVTLPAPPEGVVSEAWVAAADGFPPATRLPGVRKEAWAYFRVAARPKSGGFSATWFFGDRAVGTVFKPATALVAVPVRAGGGPLPFGNYTCVLSAGDKVVATASVRIG